MYDGVDGECYCQKAHEGEKTSVCTMERTLVQWRGSEVWPRLCVQGKRQLSSDFLFFKQPPIV